VSPIAGELLDALRPAIQPIHRVSHGFYVNAVVIAPSELRSKLL
jgi:hypothetical protein